MKKTMYLLLVITMLSSCDMMPCLTKESFISSSNDTFAEFKEDKVKLSDVQWLEIDNKMESYLSDCYPKYVEELSSEELKIFWLNTSQYFIKRAYKGPEMKKSLQELYASHFEKYMEKMGNKFADRFKDLININVDNAVDKFFDLLSTWGKEK